MTTPPLTRPVASSALALLFAILIIGCEATGAVDSLRDGDIIFQISRSNQSVAIQHATHSQYSHMGMILYRSGKPYVFEAHGPVGYTPLQPWIARGKNHKFVVKRLRQAVLVLDSTAVAKIRTAAKTFEGKPYDLTFEWSDDRMYCSELVWKTYKVALGLEIGHCQEFRELDLDDPVVKAKLRERFGDHLPLDEPVISPAAMFASPDLETVIEK